jgi:cytochrome c-type biogenesis protein CcmH/NrfG
MTPLFQDPQAEIAALNDQKNINYIINEIILNRDADPDTDPNIKETCNKLIKYLQEKLNQDTDNNQQEDSCGIIINAKFNIL